MVQRTSLPSASQLQLCSRGSRNTEAYHRNLLQYCFEATRCAQQFHACTSRSESHVTQVSGKMLFGISSVYKGQEKVSTPCRAYGSINVSVVTFKPTSCNIDEVPSSRWFPFEWRSAKGGSSTSVYTPLEIHSCSLSFFGEATFVNALPIGELGSPAEVVAHSSPSELSAHQMAPAEVIAHSSHRPFVGKAPGHINSDCTSLLVSQGSELLSCVILVKPRYCACLFWCQTGYTVVVSNSLMRAARTSDVSRVCRAVGHRPSNGSLCTRVFCRCRQGRESCCRGQARQRCSCVRFSQTCFFSDDVGLKCVFRRGHGRCCQQASKNNCCVTCVCGGCDTLIAWARRRCSFGAASS